LRALAPVRAAFAFDLPAVGSAGACNQRASTCELRGKSRVATNEAELKSQMVAGLGRDAARGAIDYVN